MRTDAPCEIRQSHFSILLAVTKYSCIGAENPETFMTVPAPFP